MDRKARFCGLNSGSRLRLCSARVLVCVAAILYYAQVWGFLSDFFKVGENPQRYAWETSERRCDEDGKHRSRRRLEVPNHGSSQGSSFDEKLEGEGAGSDASDDQHAHERHDDHLGT